jgi:CheY-like chemotaxis protein
MVVQDTGTGMSAEVLARVFEPFFTTKPRERGTGLGMAVVHGIVTDHGGRIDIESKEGQGTRVTVTFPRCAAPSAEISPPESPPAIRGLGETILVVDDNPQVLAIITSTLRSAGYQTVSASDGDAAMTTFEANRERTRLVILDLDLPRRSGLACLKEMRKHRSDLRALLISGSIEADLESAANNHTRIVRKPFQVRELGRIVSELLNGGECDESVDAG